jgi:glucosamine-6-phosphate deaminase
MDRANRQFLLGFDGGGTKTAAVLADVTGHIVARSRTTGCAIVGAPHPEAAETIRSVCRDLCDQAGVSPQDILAAGVGMNGIDFADEYESQLAGVAAALELPVDRIRLVNDGIPALWGATAAPAAAIIQHGTGFTAAWRSQNGNERLFDHLNNGKQFDLREQLPIAVSRMLDGRLPETPLLAAALGHYGMTDREAFPDLLYRGRIPWSARMSVVPLIAAAWEAGDPVATQLVERAADDYALTARILLAKTGVPNATVALGGGVFRMAGSAFRELVSGRIRTANPMADIIEPRLPPENGALLMAAHLVGRAKGPLFSALSKQTPVMPAPLSKLSVDIYPTEEALGDALAARLLIGIRAAGAARRPYLLGCPGGRSARSTYLALGRKAAASRVSLAHVVIVMMDNYVIPCAGGGYEHCADDAHYSCRRFALDEIWHPLNAGLPEASRVRRDNVWLPDPAEPAAYDSRLQSAGGVDFFIIASGASDGHVAFNPPGSTADSTTRIIPLASSTRRDNMATFPEFNGRLDDVPAFGVSVGLGTIARHSREVALIIHGGHKQEALRRLAACSGFDPAWPASIIHGCQHARLLLDQTVAQAFERDTLS